MWRRFISRRAMLRPWLVSSTLSSSTARAASLPRRSSSGNAPPLLINPIRTFFNLPFELLKFSVMVGHVLRSLVRDKQWQPPSFPMQARIASRPLIMAAACYARLGAAVTSGSMPSKRVVAQFINVATFIRSVGQNRVREKSRAASTHIALSKWSLTTDQASSNAFPTTDRASGPRVAALMSWCAPSLRLPVMPTLS